MVVGLQMSRHWIRLVWLHCYPGNDESFWKHPAVQDCGCWLLWQIQTIYTYCSSVAVLRVCCWLNHQSVMRAVLTLLLSYLQTWMSRSLDVNVNVKNIYRRRRMSRVRIGGAGCCTVPVVLALLEVEDGCTVWSNCFPSHTTDAVLTQTETVQLVSCLRQYGMF